MSTSGHYKNAASFPLIFAFAGICACVAFTSGCEPPDDRATRFPVSGKVTQGGTPVAGAVVTFVPKEKNGSPAFATTNDAGEFKLTTFSPEDGAIPGDYHVKVEKYDSTGTPAPSDSTDGASELNMDDYEPGDDTSSEPKNLLPAKYADPYNSGLLFRVIEEENVFDIPLD